MTREECIERLQNMYEYDSEAIEAAISALESQRDVADTNVGKWLGGELGECSVCGHYGCASDIWDRCTYTYCPNCGAHLEV